MTAYYNEIDPYAAEWLRNLIKAGHIADGVVDERDIQDVEPRELREFTQCHFFAGVGVWSYALRRAGWPDDRPVWTGSCPCQPFSAAGKGAGVADERHLWPAWFHLIRLRKPDVVFGEQVEAAVNHGWLDLVQSDMEGEGYAFGPVDFPACGVGAPHIRQRLWFVAERLADTNSRERHRIADGEGCFGDGAQAGREQGDSELERSRAVGELAHPNDTRSQGRSERRDGAGERVAGAGGLEREGHPGPVNGFWGASDWLFCRDGKWRPVEPGAQQMVDGSTASLGRVCAEDIADVEKAVEAWAFRHQRDGTEAVRNLWDVLSQEETGQRTDGGFDSVREAPFLLAFLRQLSDQGWRFPIGDERAGSKASRTAVRVLRYIEEPCYSSRQRGLDEQQPGELADSLRQLSQILAHYTEASWGQSGWQNAGSFPLAVNTPARAGRLRAYGNAVVAQAAQAVIESYMEAA